MPPEVRVRRVYEEPAPGDGMRVLVDRIWPRGLRKDAARLDEWARDLAPSTELRTWYGHDPAKFGEFRRRYQAELGFEPTDPRDVGKPALFGGFPPDQPAPLPAPPLPKARLVPRER